ncbi:bifunctional DNA primase/polymerase [Sphaerisporangium sp. NPDC049002]|uniref:bifunctional DNA primase/polymerase n=1 Tax=Sphaerisporangium sp. NPDC049002 TaxID=3155392 RepID=UPI0033E7B009
MYVERGWLGPLPLGEKNPAVAGRHGFPDRYPFPTKEEIECWAVEFAGNNIGVRAPMTVVGIDIDAHGKKGGGKLLDELEAELGPLPPTYRSTARHNNSTSGIRWYQVPEGSELIRYPGGQQGGIEIIRPGTDYGRVPPSFHEGVGKDYRWYGLDGHQADTPHVSELTPLPAQWLARLTKLPVNYRPPGNTELRYSSGDGTFEGLRILRGEIEKAWPKDRDKYGWNSQLFVSVKRVFELVAGGELEDEFTRQAFIKMALDAGMYDECGEHEQLSKIEATVDSGRNEGLQRPSNRLREEGTMATGELRGDESIILYKRVVSTEDGNQTKWEMFSNFNMSVVGKVRNTDGTIDGYNVELVSERTGQVTETYLPIAVLTDARRLNTWLQSHEVAMVAKYLDSPPWTVRLGTYLAAQNAPEVRIVPFWGWDDVYEGFITDQGVIRATGLERTPSVKPDPGLANRHLVSHRYGFEADENQAVSMLKEVLTFHDETVTSVVGSWWVGTKLKGQIMREFSLFPILKVEAVSESAKTKGFFELLFKLDGNTREQSIGTAAAFRDSISAHRNGYVWVDDMREINDQTKEILRNATAEKEHTKKDGDANGNTRIKLVAPIMLSGEGFGFGDEKAMPDRTVDIDLPDPKKRMSYRDPSRPQWDDIIAFKRRYPDPTIAAGTLTAMILQHADMVQEHAGHARRGSGRFADKMGIIRVGAMVLAEITGDPSHIDRVEEWIGKQVNAGNENALTKLLIPTAVQFLGGNEKPVVKDLPPYYGLPCPVLLRNDKNGTPSVWVHTENLAAWWERHNRGKVEVRTHTAEALDGQAKAIGMKGQTGESNLDWWKTRADKPEGGKSYVTYRRVPDEIASRWIEEMTGEDDGEAPGVLGGASTRAAQLAARGPRGPRSDTRTRP